jgi:hypothetical protein
MQDGASGDHLGVKAGTARQLTMKESAVPVSPVHHGRDAEAPVTFFF